MESQVRILTLDLPERKLTTRIRSLGSPPAPVPGPLPTTPILYNATKTDESPNTTKAPNLTTPGRTAPRSPVVVPGTTAQDLLNNVMGAKRGALVDVSRPQRPPTSSTITPQFPFGLGRNAPPSIWSTSLDQGSFSPLNSPSMGLRSDANVGQAFPSPNLPHAWSPQLESTQAGRQLAPQPPPHFQSPQSLSAVSPGHHQSVSLSSGMPQHVPQPPFQASYSLSSPMTQFAEHRQSQWQNSSNVSFIDPAIVSAATPSQLTPHYGGRTSYQGFSNGHTQQYIRPGQHHKSPSTSRTWGSHG